MRRGKRMDLYKRRKQLRGNKRQTTSQLEKVRASTNLHNRMCSCREGSRCKSRRSETCRGATSRHSSNTGCPSASKHCPHDFLQKCLCDTEISWPSSCLAVCLPPLLLCGPASVSHCISCMHSFSQECKLEEAIDVDIRLPQEPAPLREERKKRQGSPQGIKNRALAFLTRTPLPVFDVQQSQTAQQTPLREDLLHTLWFSLSLSLFGGSPLASILPWHLSSERLPPWKELFAVRMHKDFGIVLLLPAIAAFSYCPAGLLRTLRALTRMS